MSPFDDVVITDEVRQEFDEIWGDSRTQELLAVLEAMGLSKDDVCKWMKSPLEIYQGQTAVELISEGRGQELIDELLALAIGNVG